MTVARVYIKIFKQRNCTATIKQDVANHRITTAREKTEARRRSRHFSDVV